MTDSTTSAAPRNTEEQLVGRDDMWDAGKACCTCDEGRAYTGLKVWCTIHPGLRDRQHPACPNYKGPMPPTRDLIEWAWGVIANAGGGNWDKETAEWREAAGKWRDAYFATKTANRPGAAARRGYADAGGWNSKSKGR
jgi:hypothetical protein